MVKKLSHILAYLKTIDYDIIQQITFNTLDGNVVLSISIDLCGISLKFS